MWAGPVIRTRDAGFFFHLAPNAACNIDRAVADIGEIGCAGWKINPPGIRGMLAHFAHDECAVAAPQRAHAKTVEHALVRKAPVAPRQETGKISLEVVGAKALGRKDRIAPDKDTSVPDLRLLALLYCKMCIDLRAALGRERPRPRPHGQIKRRDAMDARRRHRA